MCQSQSTLTSCWASSSSIILSSEAQVEQVDIPLDHMLQACAGGGQRRLEIVHDLLGLRGDVAPANDRSGRVDRVLPADIHGFHRTTDCYGLCEGRIAVQRLGVEILHTAGCVI